MTSKNILNFVGGFLVVSYYLIQLFLVVGSENLFMLIFFLFAPMIYIPFSIVAALFFNFWTAIGSIIWLGLGFYLFTREE